MKDSNVINKMVQELKESELIQQLIKTNQLTDEEIINNIPILFDAIDEMKKGKFKCQLIVDKQRVVLRQYVLTDSKLTLNPVKNIISQHISWVDPSFSLTTMKKNRGSFTIALTSVKPFLKKLKTKNNDACLEKGVYFYGDIGVGKSYFMKIIANMSAKYNKTVAFLNVSEFLSFLKSDDKKYSFYLKLKQVDVLFFDDIGGESIVEWFRDDFLFNILNWRSENKKITFFSSHYSLSELEKVQSKTTFNKQYQAYNGKKLIERIKSLAKPIKITGRNLRD